MTLKRVKVSGKRIRAKLSIFDVELNDLPVNIAAFSRSFLLVKTFFLGKILVFELTYMFRWQGGNIRIVQIAKASSQSGSGGFRKDQKL